MQYPLELSFKLVALAPQLRITEPGGKVVMYVKQKLFKLKEAVGVFADESQSQKLFDIGADRVIDFSAKYNFTSADGRSLGAVKRQGMKSIFKAHFDIMGGNESEAALTIQEANPWVKFLDALFSSIPVVGMFSGYILHPEYQVSRADGTLLMTLKKQPAFFEGKFTIEKNAEPRDADEEHRMLLSLLMMVLLERSRG